VAVMGLDKLRRLLQDDVSLERAYAELNRRDCAAAMTVEALVWSLRERGLNALQEPATKRRLSQLNDEQLVEVGNRLQRFRPEIARPWTSDEIKELMRLR
jgi:transposase